MSRPDVAMVEQIGALGKRVEQIGRARTWWRSLAEFAESELETAGLEGKERDRAERAIAAARRAARLPAIEQVSA